MRLTKEQALEIFESRTQPTKTKGALVQKLMKVYGVSDTTITDIWAGYSWNSVTGLKKDSTQVRTSHASKSDSVEKIIQSYFACITSEPFTHNGLRYEPRPLYLSPTLFNGYSCPAQCGACCNNNRYTLDYIPGVEETPYDLPMRNLEFNGHQIPLYTEEHKGQQKSCTHLRTGDGRCDIHGKQAFSCDFELIRFLVSPRRPHNQMHQTEFGRGWNMEKVDGVKGALCEKQAPTPEIREDTVRRLVRLKQWAEHFKLKTCIDEIIKYVETGPHVKPKIINLPSTEAVGIFKGI